MHPRIFRQVHHCLNDIFARVRIAFYVLVQFREYLVRVPKRGVVDHKHAAPVLVAPYIWIDLLALVALAFVL